jgi:pimeloyl-ACP methyl ester carboxylesterase
MTTQPFHPFRSERAKAEFQALCPERAKAWPVPSETRLIDTPSGQTFVRVSGCSNDRPLVLLSGARGTSLMWVPNIAALSAHHRTYALDTVTDIGLSVGRAGISKAEDLLKWLDEVLTVLVPEGPLDLMGMSYGGWLASQYALRFPSRLRKVVLLAPASTVLPLSLGFLIRVALIAMPFPGRHGGPVRRMIRWLFQDLVRSGDAGRRPAGQGIAEVFEMLEMDRFFALLWMIWPTVIDDEAWRGFSVPGLFLVGENEKIYSAEAAVRRLNRVAPQIKTEIIPGAGHDLTLVQPDLVAERILGFLGEPAPEVR